VKNTPRLRIRSQRVAGLTAECFEIVEELESHFGGAAGGVLVSHRIAETRQQPLLIALHDRSVEPAHRLVTRALEGTKGLCLVLCVEAQVRLGLEQLAPADQDGYLSALGPADVLTDRF
jgi:hypothetical protein